MIKTVFMTFALIFPGLGFSEDGGLDVGSLVMDYGVINKEEGNKFVFLKRTKRISRKELNEIKAGFGYFNRALLFNAECKITQVRKGHFSSWA